MDGQRGGRGRERGGGGGGSTGGPGGGEGSSSISTPALPPTRGVHRPRGGGTCGDGIIQRSEQCDDGNTASDDGCSRICQIEANWDCPAQGQPCEYLGNCGNGKLTSNKACDDGNTKSGDGCSGDCQTIESGYICRKPGKPCTTLCGDAKIMGSEECDDGNATSGDGCSAICRMEPGWTCTKTTPSTCTHSVCGNKQVEAGEGCDDGNTVPFDGCSPTCQNDPKCGTATSAVGECKTTCGDGILIRGAEECDDGNAARRRRLLEGLQDGAGQHLPVRLRQSAREARDPDRGSGFPGLRAERQSAHRTSRFRHLLLRRQPA